MAGLLRRAARALSLAAALAAAPAAAQPEPLPPGYHDRPVLVVDPGSHTARITRADVDSAGRFVVTASEDKTVRVWNAETGALTRTIRLPAGPGNIGKAYSVAISPDGTLIAAGGWTAPEGAGATFPVFLHARESGAVAGVIAGLPDVAHHLAFSPDGRFLAATLGGREGLRVFDRQAAWAEVARDERYRDQSYGATFAADGRLATTSYDRAVRLYGTGPAFKRLGESTLPGTAPPFGIAFSPDGRHLAVGYIETPRVDVLDGHTLAPLHTAATEGLDRGSLGTVAWWDGDTLLAAGRDYTDAAGSFPVIAWANAGRGARRSLSAGTDTVMSLRPLPNGDLVVAAQDPWLGRLSADGSARWAQPSPIADYRDQRSRFGVSHDGSTISFGFEPWGRADAWFDLATRTLAHGLVPEGRTVPPVQHGLPIENWPNSLSPTLDGRPLLLDAYESSRSLAIHPDGARFVLGASWSLRAFSATGEELWRSTVPGHVWAANISGDGRLVVAAYGDGTIRWHRMDDGREILAFMPLADRTNWVAWTPEGFHAATPGAHGVLRWHINHPGFATTSHAVADIPGFHRPDAIPLVVQELETARALGIATIAEQRRQVALLTQSGVPPGARLHLLAIGISRYNERHAAHLRLAFADKDARDVASALAGTQEGLYVPGTRQFLADEEATRPSIRRALAAMQAAMGGGDLAVVHFSGHGALIDGALYLLPHDVDARDAVAIKDSALPVTALREELLRLAERGRVLVLLDACHSGGASSVPAALLTGALAAANVTVLTSSSESEASREDPAWQNGAFTKAVLEALGSAADADRDGLLSAPELAAYVDRRVRALTNGRQSPAMELRFGGTLFSVR